jgi:O-antigen/teichoic acid export membrane protein
MKMRIKHSIRNIYISIASQAVITILGFIARKIFLDNLGATYLGINGLLTNVLSSLVLVEGGIATSIVYNLYKPLEQGDKKKIIALIQLYKKAYRILAIITLVLGMCFYPFLGDLMKGSKNIPSICVIYFMFVAKSVVSYLNAHKWSLINADQRGYILAKYNLYFQILTSVSRVVILLLSNSFVYYLATELSIYILQNIFNGRIVNQRYKYINTKRKYELDLETKNNIIKNVKAVFFHNIGGYLVFSTDNILISSFIGVVILGIYSNYTMITQQLEALVSPIFGGIGASVGNLIAEENKEKTYFIFKVSFLLNFWIYSLCIIFLYNLLEPFIYWWLGKEYLLDNITFLFILINFYLNGMRTAIQTFKNKAGLFVQDKYVPILEGGINLISSIILVKFYGLAGIFIGTTLSTIVTVLWTQPFIVYKFEFKKRVLNYFSRYGCYAFLTIVSCLITRESINFLITDYSFFSLIERGVISIVVPNIIYILIFFKSREFKYLYKIAMNITLGIRQKLKTTQKEPIKETI